MQIRKPTYTVKQKLSGLLMILALAWLTVCLPYVAESQQDAGAQIETSAENGAEDCSNPLSNEEKTEPGTSQLAEYLHELPEMEHDFIAFSDFNKCHPSDLYLAYHPKLIIPPPEA